MNAISPGCQSCRPVHMVGRRVVRLAIGLVVALLVTVQPARADLFTIDPNDFAIGTDISGLFPGLTISYLGGNIGPGYHPVRSPATVSTSISPDTRSIGGTQNLWDWEDCVNFGFGCSGWTVIEMLFDRPTDFVSIGSVWREDSPTVIAYDSLGNVVDRCNTFFGDDGGGCAVTVSPGDPTIPYSMTSVVSTPQSAIARVVFGGTFGASQATKVSYNKVPEPGTLGLMAMGLLGAIFVKRRKR